jgi:hypothetical protein
MKKIILLSFLLFVSPLIASGSFEDNMANFMSWVVLIVMPIGGIYLFWMAHIYPEKVAEKNNHPQLEAIKTMCLLSLFVGGLLWPFALIWANYNYADKKKEVDDLINSTDEIEEKIMKAEIDPKTNEEKID